MITLGLLMAQQGSLPWWVWASFGVEFVYMLVKQAIKGE